MTFDEHPSELRIEKTRTDAVVTLAGGASVSGHVFVAQASAILPGPEGVAELLNSESGFFPFQTGEAHGARTVLYNRDHVVAVAIHGDEARRDPGYDVATERKVSVLLSNGQRILGSVRVHRPEGRDRLSDWARHGERFRYVETAEATYIVNVDHVVEVHEVIER